MPLQASGSTSFLGCGHIILVSASVVISPFLLCPLLGMSLRRTAVIVFRTYPDNLVGSLYPKIICKGSGGCDVDIWGTDSYSTLNSTFHKDFPSCFTQGYPKWEVSHCRSPLLAGASTSSELSLEQAEEGASAGREGAHPPPRTHTAGYHLHTERWLGCWSAKTKNKQKCDKCSLGTGVTTPAYFESLIVTNF